jgi:hypothetical protein
MKPWRQFENAFDEWEAGYRKLECKCGRVVSAPYQATQCQDCAKAARAQHTREHRARAAIQRAFGNCMMCGQPLAAERQSRKYCSPACRQKAYRERWLAAALR